MSGITIAIDGYSSCGKSTLAKEIARELNYVYVDSGAMYRAVTLHMIQEEIIVDGTFEVEEVISELPKLDIAFSYESDLGKSVTLLNGQNVESLIRNPKITREVSAISAISEVRQKLVLIQQEMGHSGAVVMDGRDIGTVVFPNADLKIFMTASKDVRAKRRFEELSAKGQKVTLQEVHDSIIRRDDLDMNREISPLKKAADAVELDNSDLNKDQQFDLAMKLVKSKIDQGLPTS